MVIMLRPQWHRLYRDVRSVTVNAVPSTPTVTASGPQTSVRRQCCVDCSAAFHIIGTVVKQPEQGKHKWYYYVETAMA